MELTPITTDDGEVIPVCACGRDHVGNLGTHCLQCELEPYGIAWQLERQHQLGFVR